MLRIDSYKAYIIILPHVRTALRVEHFGPFKCWDVYSLRHRQLVYRTKIKSPV